VQHEAQSILLWRTLVFEDHAAVSILRTLIGILAAHEGKTYRPLIVLCGSSDGAAHPAAVPMRIGEAIPINRRWPESAGQNAAGKVGFGG
jgi:hypothetical protein